jgi:hypothetical protein
MDYTQLIIQKLNKAKAARSKHEDEISEAYQYTYPNRDVWRTYEGTTDRTKLFDATASDSVQNLLSTILTLLIPQNQQWGYIGVRDDKKDTVGADIRRVLDNSNKMLFKTIRESSFYVSTSEALLDAIVGGTGCLAIYNNPTGFDFVSVPTSQLYFLTDYKDNVDTVFREHYLDAQYLFETYGEFDGEIAQMAHKAPETKIPVLESVCRLTGDKQLTYRTYVTKNNVLVDEQPVVANPFIVFRFAKTLGETWGESLVRAALPHIRTVNEVAKLILTQASWAGLGAFQTSSDTTVNYSNMKLEPGNVITVDQPLQPIPFPGNFSLTNATLEDQRQAIRTMLLNDSMAPFQTPTYMTATEIQLRQNEFFRRMGPYGLRLENEFLKPLLRTLVKKLQNRGLIPEYVREDGETFEIIVNSAVKKGMAQAEITRDLQLVQAVSSLGGQALQLIDMQKLARKILRDGDASPEIIRTARELEQLAEQQEQQQLFNQTAQIINEQLQQQSQPQPGQTPPTTT